MGEEKNISKEISGEPIQIPEQKELTENVSPPEKEIAVSEITTSDIQSMEVHHHPQIQHKPKPWKEYLLEGLMIFLAVTLGFFAENYREHITETHRENEFAKALYSELLGDSAEAANKLAIRLEKEKDMDYLNSFFKDSVLTVLPKNFYIAFTTSLFLINSYAFEPKDGILSQLKNSGSLRYFKSIELQRLLGDISVCINNVRYRNEQEYQYFASPIKPFLLKYYDFNWLDQLRKEDNTASLVNVINNYRKSDRTIEGRMLNVSSFDRNEACNLIMFNKQMNVSTRSLQLSSYIITNHKTLQVLRETYSLDN